MYQLIMRIDTLRVLRILRLVYIGHLTLLKEAAKAERFAFEGKTEARAHPRFAAHYRVVLRIYYRMCESI